MSNRISGNIAEAQTVTISGGAIGADLTADQGFVNAGTIVLTSTERANSATLHVTSGILLNAATGVISVNPGSGGTRQLFANVTNDGTININTDVKTQTTRVRITNNGQFNIVDGATFVVVREFQVFEQAEGSLMVDGTLEVVGDATFEFNGGTIGGRGTLDVPEITSTSNGEVSPGSGPETAGALTFTGNYTQGKSGSLRIELGGLDEGSQHDALIVSAIATLDGRLTVSLINDFFPVVDDEFEIMTFGSRAGVFANIEGLDIGNGLMLVPAYNSTNITLKVIEP